MLSEIKKTIVRDARKEGEDSIRRAEEEVEAELARVKAEGEAKVALAEREAHALIEGERRERLSWAKLEAKRTLAEAREDVVNAAMDVLISRMNAYSGTRSYTQRMKAMISLAVREMGGNAVVHVKRAERKSLSVSGATVLGDADIIGGAVVESKDGRLRIDLSLEALLNAHRDEVRKDIYSRLFRE